ncbi:MAG: SCO family protein [Rickettsiaceae bacterium]|nr:SCO family protein [Rickettsiaceae bacterium]
MIHNDSKYFSKILTIIATLLITLSAYFYLSSSGLEKKKYGAIEHRDAINIGGDFRLQNLNGEYENTSSSLTSDFRLIYFGFTYCPDICPATLELISNAVELTNKYGITVDAVFVTIDPARDTTNVLRPYLNHINNKIIGYTGTVDEIKQVADLFKVYYNIAPCDNLDRAKKEGTYLLDHSSFIYLLSREGKFIHYFDSSESPINIANFIHKEASLNK